MDKIQDAIAKARATRGLPKSLQIGCDQDTNGNPLWADLPAHTPNAKRLIQNRIVAHEAGRGATDFDVIRTRLLQQMALHGWRRIAITSPTAGCGKSTLVMNLAFSLARLSEHRTLVAEMDMRKPAIATTLGMTGNHRFSEVLAGRAAFEDHAMRVGDNLIFATNDAPVPDAAELMQSSRTARTLDQITAAYDPTVMLFDMPPMLTGDDTMAFLGRVDAVLLIAAAEQSTIKQIDTCERDIASQTNVMGVILNKCRYADHDTDYGSYD